LIIASGVPQRFVNWIRSLQFRGPAARTTIFSAASFDVTR
jgi:hypothetical protein